MNEKIKNLFKKNKKENQINLWDSIIHLSAFICWYGIYKIWCVLRGYDFKIIDTIILFLIGFITILILFWPLIKKCGR